MTHFYFLGPRNSYSHIAAKQLPLRDVTLVACKNFAEVVEKVVGEKESIGLLPIENSITSDIYENIDALFKNKNLSIIGEVFLQIHLYLIGLEEANISDINIVYSHPRALAQCTYFIQARNLKMHEVSSTSYGKDEMIERSQKNIGVIGSKELVETGKTKILAKDIGNDKLNMTRFVCISQNTSSPNKVKNKMSIIFKVPHKPGSLAIILKKLADFNLNLTKIESRPIPGTNWEYYFWVDVEKENLNMEILKKTLQESTSEYRILGVYKKGDVFIG